VTERALEVLRAVREVGAEARAAGELVSFLTELERVRLELVVAPPVGRSTDQRDRLLTVKEAAAKIGMSVWWVRGNKDALPIVRLSTGRYQFSEKGLEKWIERRASQ
jgi:predicted DNA-binding transcriptional regulator AlpA